uniref:tRNA (guanine(10)-N(2))-methyltransferase TRMT11 n=1 Tax=Steinernema glaseri TaxID=37863 RepID=A0A1I7Z8K3_9BILA
MDNLHGDLVQNILLLVARLLGKIRHRTHADATMDLSPTPRRYVFVFSQQHLNFRLAELESVSSLFNIRLSHVSDVEKAHVCVVEAESDADVQTLLSRSMLLRSAYELLAEADTYEQFFELVEKEKASFQRFNDPTQSFAFRLRKNGRKADSAYVKKKIHELGGALPLEKAVVELDNPTNVFTLVEEFTEKNKTSCPDKVYFGRWNVFTLVEEFTEKNKTSCPDKVYFGRWIGDGQGSLKAVYNLQDRVYIGNTTMDPELAFIQANIIKAGVGSLVLDPFCGTGGLVLPAAHFGSAVFGTEINYMIAKARGKSSRQGVKYLTEKESLQANFDQYGTTHLFQSLVIADASRHGLWNSPSSSGIFDALIADPPYGVREKCAKVGRKEPKEGWIETSTIHPQRFPEKSKYDLCDVFLDLLNLAARVLVVGGRVAYWFPVFPEE